MSTRLTAEEGSGFDDRGNDWTASLAESWQFHHKTASAADAVYLALRDAISSGAVAPGEQLPERTIVDAIKISRTPVREALLRLQAERLVERGATQRLVVAQVSPEEVLDVYAVREVLNGLAARLAAENASDTDLIRLRRLHREIKWAADEGDIDRVASLNIEFHDAICVASRNQFLLEILRHALDNQNRYHGSIYSVPGQAAQSVEDHEGILQAIEARDGQRAADLAEQHTHTARTLRMTMLDGTLEEGRRRVQQAERTTTVSPR